LKQKRIPWADSTTEGQNPRWSRPFVGTLVQIPSKETVWEKKSRTNRKKRLRRAPEKQIHYTLPRFQKIGGRVPPGTCLENFGVPLGGKPLTPRPRGRKGLLQAKKHMTQ